MNTSEVFLINNARLDEMYACMGVVAQVAKKHSGIKAYCNRSECARDVGSIRIEGNRLLICPSTWFSEIARIADFTDIYPLANGDIRVEFAFNGLMIPQ